MQAKQGKECKIIVPVIVFYVIKYDSEVEHSRTKKTADKCCSKFFQHGFFVKGIVCAGNRVERQPAKGYKNYPNPEISFNRQAVFKFHIITKKIFSQKEQYAPCYCGHNKIHDRI